MNFVEPNRCYDHDDKLQIASGTSLRFVGSRFRPLWPLAGTFVDRSGRSPSSTPLLTLRWLRFTRPSLCAARLSGSPLMGRCKVAKVLRALLTQVFGVRIRQPLFVALPGENQTQPIVSPLRRRRDGKVVAWVWFSFGRATNRGFPDSRGFVGTSFSPQNFGDPGPTFSVN